MPSPLPGMDPFLEGEEWEDFHARFNPALADFLSARVDPGYLVRVERRVYVEHVDRDEAQWRVADVGVLRSETDDSPGPGEGASAVATLAPVPGVLPMPEERRETYLVIREQQSREVITVIETLSPANKRPGGDGRREYLRKREEVLRSDTHLVELDLLRGGQRLPMLRPLPAGDYYAIVSRGYRRPRADIYAWTLRHPLPVIPAPLAVGLTQEEVAQSLGIKQPTLSRLESQEDMQVSTLRRLTLPVLRGKRGVSCTTAFQGRRNVRSATASEGHRTA
jgi:hypothetical protein